MFHHEATLEYRQHAADGVLQGGKATAAVLWAEAQVTQQRLAAERALDAVLADSFPASDPPSWTLGVSHSPLETNDAGAILAHEDNRESQSKKKT
jgi:hypothetical protein